MDQARLFIAIALSFLVFFVWSMFFNETPTPPETPQGTEAPQPVPTAPAPAPTVAPGPSAGEAKAETPAQQDTGRLITIKTPLYTAQISENGAVFKSLALSDYRESTAADSPNKAIIGPENPYGTVRVAFDGNRVPALADAVFRADTASEEIVLSTQKRAVTFSWQAPTGIVLQKQFRFSPDSYLIEMDVTVANQSSADFGDRMVVSLFKFFPEVKAAYGFEGPSAVIGKKLEQIKRKKIKDQSTYEGRIRWIATEGRYFMSALMPRTPVDASMRVFLSDQDILENQLVLPAYQIPPGSEQRFEFALFFGPKSLQVLKKVDYDLNKAVNFGMFDILAKPCLYFMNLIYSVIPNYGIAIILLTIIIKILLWPLGSKSYKSMNDMKRLQPLMAEIREKHKGDKQKMNQEMMALYKTYKINPMGGCLPMFMQLPVFFALYRMLYEAIELRHAPFFGWIGDLSAPDRLFNFDFAIPFMQPPYGIPVLTLVMGASMFFQQKMSPPPGDPTQAKMMMFMPIVFTFIFINFSSGLVLYWLVNNLLSMAQQYYIQKKNA